MTVIRGPNGGHAHISGTSGNDLIIAQGGYNTINGGGGNDTIDAGTGHAYLVIGSTGDGLAGTFDNVSVAGAGNMVAAGDEAVLILGHVRASTFTLGDGSNTVQLDGGRNSISAGNGNNIVGLDGASNSLTLGNGNNSVDVVGANNTILAGAGQNTISATGGGANVSLFAVGQASYGPDTVFVSGAGNVVSASFFHIPEATFADVDVYGGSGHGTFTLPGDNGFSSTAQAGSVDNVVTGGVDNLIQAGGGLIVAGSGADTVGFSGENTKVVLAGAGNSVSCVAGTSTITGGSGSGSFNLSGQYLYGPTGPITLQTYGAHNAVSLFDGGFQVAAGSGQDTVSALIASGTIAFYGAGDKLLLSDGQDLTVENHAIGLDVVISQGDTGALTIEHFGAGSVLDLNTGDGYSDVGQVLAALTETSAGTYSLATSDGGTVVFAGVAHLSADNFKIG